MGFLPVATRRTCRWRSSHPGFNPAVGFLPFATVLPVSRVRRTDRVSIPQWVFSPLQLSPSSASASAASFQSRSGFSPRCNVPPRRPRRRRSCFNPAVGFLPVATARRCTSRRSTLVSIPQWVFSPLQPGVLGSDPGPGSVSIPQWVFSPLQLVVPAAVRVWDTRVSIPQWVFSPLQHSDGTDSETFDLVSIPQWVFSPLQHPRLYDGGSCPYVSIPQWVFSPLQLSPGPSPCAEIVVSIPQWVFSPLQLGGWRGGARGAPFQSRSGFSPRCNRAPVALSRHRDVFQSRSGFSPRCNVADLLDGALGTVSFNPAVGFLPVATVAPERREPDLRSVSIPQWVFSPLQR